MKKCLKINIDIDLSLYKGLDSLFIAAYALLKNIYLYISITWIFPLMCINFLTTKLLLLILSLFVFSVELFLVETFSKDLDMPREGLKEKRLDNFKVFMWDREYFQIIYSGNEGEWAPDFLNQEIELFFLNQMICWKRYFWQVLREY